MSSTEKNNWKLGIGVFQDNIKKDRRAFEDRRKASRIELSIPIRYHIQDSATEWQSVEALDLSMTGVRITINQPVAVHTMIELEVKLPGIEEPFTVLGQIAWILPAFNDATAVECGIAFHNLKQMAHRDHFVNFMADKFCHLSAEQPKDLLGKPASNIEELKTAFKIIHREYLKRGYCKAQASEMFYSYYALLKDSRTFVLEKAGEIHGTLSLMTDSPCGLPMESLFPEEIAQLRAQGRKLAENSLLALDQSLLGNSLFSLTHSEKHLYFFTIVKIMVDCARDLGVTDLLIAVHPKHEDLYRFLTFEPIGPVRPYPGALGNLALPMRWQIDDPAKFMPKDSGVWKYFSQAPASEAVRSSYVRWDAQNVVEFLAPIWDKLPAKAKEHFKKVYNYCAA